MSEICPDLTGVVPCVVPSIPSWKLHQPEVNLSLTNDKKDCTDALLFRSKFVELKGQYEGYNAIYTDGSKDGNKVAAAAVSALIT